MCKDIYNNMFYYIYFVFYFMRWRRKDLSLCLIKNYGFVWSWLSKHKDLYSLIFHNKLSVAKNPTFSKGKEFLHDTMFTRTSRILLVPALWGPKCTLAFSWKATYSSSRIFFNHNLLNATMAGFLNNLSIWLPLRSVSVGELLDTYVLVSLVESFGLAFPWGTWTYLGKLEHTSGNFNIPWGMSSYIGIWMLSAAFRIVQSTIFPSFNLIHNIWHIMKQASFLYSIAYLYSSW
jgi:hypothetical protein